MDEFDIEMTNLRDWPAVADAPIGDSADHPGHDTGEPTQSGVRTPLAKRLSCQRLFRALAVILTILLPLALILGTNANTRAALDSLLHPVTIFANSTAPGAEQFDLVHIAPCGDMRIDGQTVPRSYVLQRFRAIRLAPGTHTLDYSAPPFAPLHCALTVPADPTGDTCPLTQNADDLYPVPNDSVRMLDLRAGFNNLSSQQLAALVKAAEGGLIAGSPTAFVAFGEHYLTADGTVATNRSRPIKATLVYHLSAHSSRIISGFESLQCSTFCFYRPLLDPSPNGWGAASEEWGVVAHVALSWRYTVPHGSVIIGPTDQQHDTIDAGVLLHITWQHGWRVAPLNVPRTANAAIFDSPICQAAQDAIWLANMQLSGWEGTSLPAADGAEGCLIQGRVWTGQSTGYDPPANLLYRFGVLLAANDEAHHAFPTLPVADASEQSLARLLAIQAGQPFP